MTEPCRVCGDTRLVAVLTPGRADVEAIVCLACGAVQPVAEHALDKRDG